MAARATLDRTVADAALSFAKSFANSLAKSLAKCPAKSKPPDSL